MKKVKWICEDTREVPGVGVFTKGDVKPVPNEIADGLIAQGLAELVGKRKDGDTK